MPCSVGAAGAVSDSTSVRVLLGPSVSVMPVICEDVKLETVPLLHFDLQSKRISADNLRRPSNNTLKVRCKLDSNVTAPTSAVCGLYQLFHISTMCSLK